MYQWYENAQVCYAYLHDVLDSPFPVAHDSERYATAKSDWPEWFSRGWTLQEMIAPSNVQFFNKNWQHIGDKRMLAWTLQEITGVPTYILTNGLDTHRPCVAQIMSWAANRTTSRVEDRAYSLMGLLGVNMPMLYGEGKKAFHRLQLEIIRTSNDQSIFAWSWHEPVRTGNILADDPSVFRSCSEMELMDPDEFIESLRPLPAGVLPSSDQLGTFPITNRGIQIWLFLRPALDDSVFEAWLPCRPSPIWNREPVTINLYLRGSNYYRFPWSLRSRPLLGTLQFRQVYLRYQDTSYRKAAFDIDDSAITERGFTCHSTYPVKFRGNSFILTTDPLCVRVYSNDDTSDCFAVGFGEFFGKDWIHVEPDIHREEGARYEYVKMLARAPEYERSMEKTRSEARVCIMQTHLRQLTLHTCVVWKGLRDSRVKLEVFQDPSVGCVSGEWTSFDVDVGGIFRVCALLPY